MRTVRIDGVVLPCLWMKEDERQFIVPLENGWNAYVTCYPRPDQAEYSIGCVTREEAQRVIDGERHLGATLTHWNLRPDLQFPRGEWDLLETLRELSTCPSPPPLNPEPACQ